MAQNRLLLHIRSSAYDALKSALRLWAFTVAYLLIMRARYRSEWKLEV
jgi:hypothetical protein